MNNFRSSAAPVDDCWAGLIKLWNNGSYSAERRSVGLGRGPMIYNINKHLRKFWDGGIHGL